MIGGSEHKSCIAERVLQTLQGRLYRYFTHNETYRYTDKLADFVKAYNKTRHSTLNRTPSDITHENEAQVWFEQYALPYIMKTIKKARTSFDKCYLVRITYIRKKFERSYDVKWTYELFTISRIVYQREASLYKLVDYAGEEIKSLFYTESYKVLL